MHFAPPEYQALHLCPSLTRLFTPANYFDDMFCWEVILTECHVFC